MSEDGEIPGNVPVFTFSKHAWDDRELIRAFDSAVQSYKGRKNGSGGGRRTAADAVSAEAIHDDHGGVVDTVQKEVESGNKRSRVDNVVVVGNVVHVEPVGVGLSKEEVLQNLLAANYWAGYWAGIYSRLE